MKEMKVSELRDRKAELEADILTAVNRFEDKTGVVVTSVSFWTVESSVAAGNESKTRSDVDIKL